MLVVYSGRKIQEGKGRGESRMTQRLYGWEIGEQSKVTKTKWKNRNGINCEGKDGYYVCDLESDGTTCVI